MLNYQHRAVDVELHLRRLPARLSLAVEERQTAWNLYVMILTSPAIYGRPDTSGSDRFDGVSVLESFVEIQQFRDAVHRLATAFPAGRIDTPGTDHIGTFLVNLVRVVLDPYLSKWHLAYRAWWTQRSPQPDLSAASLQDSFPLRTEVENDWAAVQGFCRKTANEMMELFEFEDIAHALPPATHAELLRESMAVLAELQQETTP